MKKSIFKRTLLTTVFALGVNTANADLLGVYIGGGIWDGSFSGTVGESENPIRTDELGLDSAQNTYFFAALEHPVPLIPNIRVAVKELSQDGNATINREFLLERGGDPIPAGASARSEIDLSHTDVTLYWEILDNYVSADIGITARKFDGFADVQYSSGDTPPTTGSERVELNGTVPMLYGKAQLDLPFTGWYAGANINYLSISKSDVRDMEAKIGYLTSGIGLEVGFEIGYRDFSVDVNEDDELEADVGVDGPFLSLIAHF